MEKFRKQRSDSTAGLLQAAQTSDRTTATAPRDVEGATQLNKTGLRIYDQLWRSRTEWTVADLMLIAQAAQVAQIIHVLNLQIALPGTTLIENRKTGAIKINPAIPTLSDQRRLFSNLLRDASVRQRDKNFSNPAPNPDNHVAPTSMAADASTKGFDDWATEILQ